jgi:hypothetical protein
MSTGITESSAEIEAHIRRLVQQKAEMLNKLASIQITQTGPEKIVRQAQINAALSAIGVEIRIALMRLRIAYTRENLMRGKGPLRRK